MSVKSAAEREREKYAREVDQLSQKAMEFYAENGIIEKLEDVLNEAFNEQPKDLFGHFANFFEAMMLPPVFSSVTTQELYDSRCFPLLQMSLSYTFKNRELHLTSACSIGTESSNLDNKSHDQVAALYENAVKEVASAKKLIMEDIQPFFTSQDGKKQMELDSKLEEIAGSLQKVCDEEFEARREEDMARKEAEEAAKVEAAKQEVTGKGKKSPKPKKSKELSEIGLEEPRSNLFFGSSAISLASQMFSIGAAALSGTALYEHLACLRYGYQPKDYKMPLPIVTILTSGKLYPGKLNYIKEFFIIPSPKMSFCEAHQLILKINAYCASTNAQRQGLSARFTNEFGAICPTLDKVEQGLDLLLEALVAFELEAGVDFYFGITCSPWENYDVDKQKYEIMTGTCKGADEMADFWQDIITRYPSLIMVVDPLRREEPEQWMNLCEKVTPQCYVVGDLVHSRPEKLPSDTFSREWSTTGIVMRQNGATTVSHMLNATKKMEGEENCIIMATNCAENNESFIVDLAVSVQAKFIKIGGLMRGEKAAKYNRMKVIEEELEKGGLLEKWPEEFEFPFLRPRTPSPVLVNEPVECVPTTQKKPNSGGKKGKK